MKMNIGESVINSVVGKMGGTELMHAPKRSLALPEADGYSQWIFTDDCHRD